MDLHIHIPKLLLWIIGGAASLAILILTIIGVCAIFWARDYSRSMGRWFGW